MESLSCQDLKAKHEAGGPITLVDLQSSEAYAHRHIPGAVHMEPSSTCGEECANLLKDKDADIVLYGEFDELGKGGQVAEAQEGRIARIALHFGIEHVGRWSRAVTA